MAQRARTHASLRPPGCLVPNFVIHRRSARFRWATLHLALVCTTHTRTEVHPCRIKCCTSGRKTLPLWRFKSQGMCCRGMLLLVKGGFPGGLTRALISNSPKLGFLRNADTRLWRASISSRVKLGATARAQPERSDGCSSARTSLWTSGCSRPGEGSHSDLGVKGQI
ncbi:uncharacterized protein LOC133545009 isoform X2 [Nerophis ophidion]|uniref:uncharacterized protein LOC133545009 isoform X2 n=1 Tax=Nerophis ophidion TaxID=159077 RepID=UPI002AE01B5F|nr:uncharacterized protein LOC133545009 isoform X2 [Nerophis ophidion]